MIIDAIGTMLHCDCNYMSVPVHDLIQLGQEDMHNIIQIHKNVTWD